jgi:hypothetical protein
MGKWLSRDGLGDFVQVMKCEQGGDERNEQCRCR